jgi:hypothetical protein
MCREAGNGHLSFLGILPFVQAKRIEIVSYDAIDLPCKPLPKWSAPCPMTQPR